jgi:hypothetical protein
MTEFDVSDDGQEVVYAARRADDRTTAIAIASVDRRRPPRTLTAAGADSPRFGPNGSVLCRSFDGTNHYLEQFNSDGSRRSKVVPYSIGNLFGVSPDRRWAITIADINGMGGGTFAVPTGGGPPRRICSGCVVNWSPDARFLYLSVQKPSLTEPGRTRVIALARDEMFPPLPPSGLTEPDEPELFPQSFLIDASAVSPGLEPSVYVYVKTSMHRNLFRIPLS